MITGVDISFFQEISYVHSFTRGKPNDESIIIKSKNNTSHHAIQQPLGGFREVFWKCCYHNIAITQEIVGEQEQNHFIRRE